MKKAFSLFAYFFTFFSVVFAQHYVVPKNGYQTIQVHSASVSEFEGPYRSYSLKSWGSLTLFPQNSGKAIKLNLTDLNLRSADELIIYNGKDTLSPVAAQNINYFQLNENVITAHNADGALTIKFKSKQNTGSKYKGFTFSVSEVENALPPLSYNDLVLTDYSLHKNATGDIISGVIYYKNGGTEQLYDVTVGVYLSNDSIFSVDDTLIGESYGSGSVDTTQNYTFSLASGILKVPGYMPDGEYYCFFVLDPHNYVNETNEQNNIQYHLIEKTTRYADIFISSINFSGTNFIAGNTLSVTNSIVNSGENGNSYGCNYYLKIYLSTDTMLGVNDTLLYSVAQAYISNNSMANINKSVNLPSNLSTGKYFIISEITTTDRENRVNNTAFQEINIFGEPSDIVLVRAAAITENIPQTNSISCKYTLYNTGKNNVSSFQTGVYLSLDTLIDINDTLLSVFTNTITGGSTEYSFSNPVFIGDDILPGDYYVIIKADISNTVNEVSKQNNLDYFTMRVLPATKDLMIQTPSTNNSLVAVGQSISLTCKIYNAGNSNTSTSNVNYYLSSLNYLDGSAILLGNTNGTTLSGGASSNRSISVSIPGVNAGVYYILFVADPVNIVNESAENNNTQAVQITISAFLKPENNYDVFRASDIDLTVHSANSNASLFVPGDNISANCNVHNFGIDATPVVSVGYYISVDNVLDGGDYFLSSTSVASIAGIDNISVSKTLLLPDTIAIGNYYLIYVADYVNGIIENNETNNNSAFPFSIVNTRPDIALQQLTSNYFINSGDSVNTSLVYYNSGNSPVNGTVINYYFSLDNSLDASDLLIDSTFSNGTSKGEKITISKYVHFPVSINQSVGFIIAEYNSYNENIDVDASNNTISGYVFIYSKNSNLISGEATFTGNVISPGYTVKINHYLYCDANSKINNIKYKYYWSADNVMDVNDELILEKSIASLDARKHNAVVNSIPIPKLANNGLNYLFIKIDSDSTLNELNENDNVSMLPIYVNEFVYDYKFESSFVESMASPGYPFKFQVSLIDKGTSVSDTVSFGLFLSSDSLIDVGDVLLDSSFCAYTYGNKFYKSYNGLSIPANTVPGNYFIIAHIDFKNDKNEIQEGNNYVSSKIEVHLNAKDLSITETSSKNIVIQNQVIYGFNYTVKNNSPLNQSAGYYSYLYASADSVIDSNDIKIDSVYGSSLNSYSSYGIQFYVDPNLIPAGNYYFIAYTDRNNILNEVDEINNFYYSKVLVENKNQDIFSTALSLSSSSVNVNDATTLYYTNTFNTNFNYCTASIGYYLSADTVLNSGDLRLSVIPNANFTNGQHTLTTNIYIPSNSLIGNLNLLVVLDSANLVNEFCETNNTAYIPITVNQRNTDFKITYFNSSAINLSEGARFLCSWGLINNGTESGLNGSSQAVYFSTDSIYQSTDILLYEENLNYTIEPNYQYNQDNRMLYMPTPVAAGNYYLIVRADNSDLTQETSELNNTKVISINVSSKNYDFELTSCSYNNTTLFPGNQINITYWVKDKGTYQMPVCDAGFYLSTDNIIDAGDVLLGTQTIQEFYVGLYEDFVPSFNIPSNTLAGTYYIIIKLDKNNLVIETNEINNQCSFPIVVNAPFPDLVSTGLTINNYYDYINVYAGNTIHVKSTVRNEGDAPSGICKVGYYLSTNYLLDSGDSLIADTTLPALAINASTIVTKNIKLDCSLPPQNLYYLFVIADYQQIIAEDNETNNSSNIDFNVRDCYLDLKPQSCNIQTSPAVVGLPLIVSGGVLNSGSGDANTSNLGYYLSYNNTFDAGDLYLGGITHGLLVSQGSYLKTDTLLIPSNVAPGNYYLLYYADNTSSETESIETNNVYSISFTIYPPFVDFEMKTATVPSNPVVVGHSFNTSYSLRNSGTIITNNSNVGVFLSTDSIYDVNDQLLLADSIGPINAWQTVNRNKTISFPSNTLPGTHFLIYYTNYNNAEYDSIPTNNILYRQIKLDSVMYDVAVKTLNAPNLIYKQQTYFVNGQIINLSNEFIDSVYVSVVLSLDTIFNSSDYVLKSSKIQNFNIGATFNQPNIYFNVDTSMADGYYYIALYANFDTLLNEINYKNNYKYYRVNVIGESHDIYTKNENGPYELILNTSNSISYYLNHKGNVASGAFKMKYYFSVDTLLSVNDILIGQKSFNSIMVNANSYTTDLVTLSDTFPSGNYYILFVADADNQIIEYNEENNIKHCSVIIGCTGQDPALNWFTINNGLPVQSSGPINLAAEFANYGYQDIPTVKYTFILSDDSIADVGDLLLGEKTELNLYGGYYRDVNFSYNFPQLADGIHYLICIADSSNLLQECNENNNVFIFPFTSSISTSLDVSRNNRIIVYPNPVNNLLYIAIKDVNILKFEILNDLGQVVKVNNNTSNEAINSIDLSSYTNGLYQIRLYSLNEVFNYSFVVLHKN